MIEISNIKYQISKTHTQNIKIFTYLVCVFYILFFIFDFAIAQPISSIELINNAKYYDGKLVVYEGEAIGDVMVRGDYAWININDGKTAIGVWIDKDLTKDIIYTGSYKSKGDWVEISGTFQRACNLHGGDLDIHAQSLKKISLGKKTLEKLNLAKRNFAYVLLGILCIVWILRQFKTR